MLATISPFPQYQDVDGSPLNDGRLYFGTVGLNPETSPITVYWDAAGTQPAAQPIKVKAGLPYRSGNPAQVYAGTDYSLTVKNKRGRLVLYAPDSSQFSQAAAIAAFSDTTTGKGDALIAVKQAGTGSIDRTQHQKNAELLSAADYGATGGSVPTDSAAIQAAGAAAVVAGASNKVRINSYVSKTIDLGALGLPTGVVFNDERYADSGWVVHHCEGDDTQLMLRGRSAAATNPEGPALVLQNLASSGNRTVSIVAWAGPTNAPVAHQYEHYGFTVDGSWYAGREWLSSGSTDTGFRARYRMGNDGGCIWNPTGDAASYRNNPAVAFSQNVLFTFNAPLQTGYAYSAKPLLEMRTTTVSIPNELELQTDVGHSGSAVANATLRFQSGNRAAGTHANKWSVLNDFPGAGQLTFYDHTAGVNKFSLITGGDVVHAGNIRPAADNTYSHGTAAARSSVVYSATGTINTSDEREKQDIGPIPEAWLRAWGDVQWVRFRWCEAVLTRGSGARWHIGLIAQRVRDVFQAHGIDAFKIGLLCYDEWPEQVIETPEHRSGDEVVIPAKREVTPAGSRFGLRYEEALALECAYLRWRFDSIDGGAALMGGGGPGEEVP